MTDIRQIAAAIELKVKQLRSQNLSDSALLDQMVGYMPELQALSKGATDAELEALFEKFPHFQHYASLLEVRQLLIEAATMESTLLQGMFGDVSGVDRDTSEVEARFHQWSAAVKRLLARVNGSDLDDQKKRDILRVFWDMGGRIRRILGPP